MHKYLSRSEELMLLTVWQLRDNAHCVPIRKHVSKTSGKSWSFGAIYIPLSRLEKKGMVESFLGEPTSKRGGKSKRYYRLTEDGLKALVEVRELHEKMWENIPKLSLSK
ncbi:PadR family transcriptional regulator [candidate division KSB1 bacterium]